MDRATEHYAKAVRYGPDLALGHALYGKALWRKGEFAEAVELQRSLISQAEVEADSRFVGRLRQNLERYERGEPSRNP